MKKQIELLKIITMRMMNYDGEKVFYLKMLIKQRVK